MDGKLKSQFEKAEQLKNKMLAAIENASKEQRHFKPEKDAWSMLDVSQHLLQSEREILRQMEKYHIKNTPKANLGAKLRAALTYIVLRLPIKIKVPKAATASIFPRSGVEMEELVKEWAEIRKRMDSLLSALPSDKLDAYIFKHPLSGLFTPKMTIQFMCEHISHHLKQIERIKTNSGFVKVN
jgi:uncharacterized damage-inducible protein DinB